MERSKDAFSHVPSRVPPKVDSLPFKISIDWEALLNQRPEKLTPDQIFRCYEKDGSLCFIAYNDPNRPGEATTLLTPVSRKNDLPHAVPAGDWDWRSVEYIGAGTVHGEGPWHFEVQWGNASCDTTFGRSYPADGAEQCQADAQVRKDFGDFLKMAQREGWSRNK